MAPVAHRTYVVRDGDTLWSIATRVAHGGDPRPLVDAIEAENDVTAGDAGARHDPHGPGGLTAPPAGRVRGAHP